MQGFKRCEVIIAHANMEKSNVLCQPVANKPVPWINLVQAEVTTYRAFSPLVRVDSGEVSSGDLRSRIAPDGRTSPSLRNNVSGILVLLPNDDDSPLDGAKPRRLRDQFILARKQ